MENKKENPFSNHSIEFKDHYSYEKFKEFSVAYGKYRAISEEDSGNQAKIDRWLDLMENFDAAVMGKINAMARLGMLSSCPHAKGRGIKWANAWDRMVAGEVPEYGWLLQEQEALSNGMGFYLLRGDAKSEEELRQNYIELVARVEKGDLPLKADAQECQATGVYYHAGLEGWQPYLFEYLRDANGKRAEVKLTQDAPELAPMNVEIPVPSGRLLAADWFRIEEFTDIVDPKETRHSGPSVNTQYGRIHQTRRYAMEHGFLSVSVGNSSPEILLSGGVFAFANLDGDASSADMSKLAKSGKHSVCTDLWQATLIDEEVLVGMLAKTMPAEEAKKKVEEYIKENDVTVVKWPKGKAIHATFMDHGIEGFSCDKVDQKGIDTLYCAASSEPLVWVKDAPALRLKPK